MAELSFPLEGHVYSAEEAGLWFATRTSGVHASDALGVTAPGGMVVNVGKGVAWLKYAEFTGAAYANTETKAMQISAADANLPRIDRIVVRYSKATNTIALAVSKGTPASTPTPPDIVRDSATHEISLAQVRVNAGATAIASSNITDERLNNAVCGLMSDGVTAYNTDGGNEEIEDPAHPGCYYRQNGSVIEWMNPPMAKGVEYRTVERYAGKPVYTVLIDCGSVSQGTRIDIDTSFAAGNVVRYAGLSEVYALPFINNTLDNAATAWCDAVVVSGKIRIRIKAGSDFGNRKACVQAWYTKDWVS